jgi:cytochrome c
MPDMSNWLNRRGALLACTLAALAAAGNAAEHADGQEAGALTKRDMQRGRILFMQCSACHALIPGDNAGKIGPSLAGVFGREAGSADYFDGYSAALGEAGHVWDSDTLNLWLSSPAAMIPGTSMVFAGISDEAQRELLVRYLKVVTEPKTD